MKFYKTKQVIVPAVTKTIKVEIPYVEMRETLKWSAVRVSIKAMSSTHIKRAINLIKKYKEDGNKVKYCGYSQSTWIDIFRTELDYREAMTNADDALNRLATFSKVGR